MSGGGTGTVLVVAAIGVSGSGKTTTIEYLIEKFTALGYRVGAVKHIHHQDFTIDTEGKNTWRFSKAGAKVVMAVSPNEVAVIKKTDREVDDFEAVLKMLEGENLEVVFVEGMHRLTAKRADIAKIVAAKDLDELNAALDGTVGPIIAIVGLVTKNADTADFVAPFVKMPEEGDRLVEVIKLMLQSRDK